MKRIALLTLAAILVYSCEIDIFPNTDESGSDMDNTEQTPGDKEDSDSDKPTIDNRNYSPVTTSMFGHAGLSYIWDESVIPEITISVSLDEWNRLLGLFDKDKNTKEYVYCDITYKKGSETHKIEDAGVRLRVIQGGYDHGKQTRASRPRQSSSPEGLPVLRG